ncbi:MAG: response regulator [Planctomycetota bacterium]
MPRSEDRRPTLLCVDDEASIRSALRRVFLEEDWEVLFAKDGADGLEVFKGADVDLVLSDFRMPGMDGIEFLKRVKEIKSDCVRIVLSGYADINLIVNALNEGEIYRFLQKPWNDEDLLHNLRKALEHHRLGRENRRLAQELRELNAMLEKKVEERTRELMEKNGSLRVAQRILEVMPMPILGVDPRRHVVYANAKARALLDPDGKGLVGAPAPALFEPELTGAIARAVQGGEGAEVAPSVLPMVLDGEPVGAIVLTRAEAPLDLVPDAPQSALPWSVAPA